LDTYALGFILIITGAVLFAIAMPNKRWSRPRFIDSTLGMTFYPGLIVALIVFGIAALLLA
jgi:uncharacterized membrane protein HdeD (DUF308 family)